MFWIHDRISIIMVEKEQARIAVRVQSNAGKNQVLGFKDGVLHLRIAAPPIKGKANKELVEFLSTLLGVSKGDISIERGTISKTKIINIRRLRQDMLSRMKEKYPTY